MMGTLPTNQKLCFNMYQIIVNLTLILNKKDPHASLPISGGRAMCNETTHVTGPYHIFMVIYTVYPKKYAHGLVVLCFVVVMQSFIMNSHEVFIHIHQGCFAGTGAIVRLPQCQWSKPDGYGKISQCITTTKHSKAVTVCIFLGIYCMTFGHGKAMAVHKCNALMYSVKISANA